MRYLIFLMFLISCTTVPEIDFEESAEVSCPKTKLINFKLSTPEDIKALDTATRTCELKYSPRSPCLISLEKKRPLAYWAICGQER